MGLLRLLLLYIFYIARSLSLSFAYSLAHVLSLVLFRRSFFFLKIRLLFNCVKFIFPFYDFQSFRLHPSLTIPLHLNLIPRCRKKTQSQRDFALIRHSCISIFIIYLNGGSILKYEYKYATQKW